MMVVLNTFRGYVLLLATFLRCWLKGVFASGNEKKHALVVCSNLPPSFSAGTFRPLSWLQHGQENNWRVDGLTEDKVNAEDSPATRELLAKVPASSAYVKARGDTFKTSFKLFPQINGDLIKALRYVNQALDTLDGEYSHVVASGPSFNTFYAAYLLAKARNAKLIVDFRDEWTLCPFDFVQRGNADDYFERLCVKRASAVLFTTQGHMENYVQKYPFITTKSHVLPNGWEEADLPVLAKHGFNPQRYQSEVEDSATKTFTLSHIGTVGQWTNPSALLDSFQQVKGMHWHLKFVGQINAAFNELPFGNAERIGKVAKSEVEGFYLTSDALLLISNPGIEKYRPLKLYDYLATGLPIIVFGVYSESARLVESLDAGVFVASDDPQGLATALRQIADEPERFNGQKRSEFNLAHTRKKLAKQFFELLEHLD